MVVKSRVAVPLKGRDEKENEKGQRRNKILQWEGNCTEEARYEKMYRSYINGYRINDEGGKEEINKLKEKNMRGSKSKKRKGRKRKRRTRKGNEGKGKKEKERKEKERNGRREKKKEDIKEREGR